jgi:hypothetical protein
MAYGVSWVVGGNMERKEEEEENVVRGELNGSGWRVDAFRSKRPA